MKCVICKNGETKDGTTTVTFARGGMTLVVKEVPASVCTNCGEDYVDEKIAHQIMNIAEQMSKTGAQVWMYGDLFLILQLPVEYTTISFYSPFFLVFSQSYEFGINIIYQTGISRIWTGIDNQNDNFNS